MKALVLAGASDVDMTLVKAVDQDDIEIIRHITTGGNANRRTLMSTLSAAKNKQKQVAAEKSYRKLTEAEIASLPKPTSTADPDRQSVELVSEGFPASSPESLADDLAVSGRDWG